MKVVPRDTFISVELALILFLFINAPVQAGVVLDVSMQPTLADGEGSGS